MTNNTKRLFALALSLVLLCALAPSAFAAPGADSAADGGFSIPVHVTASNVALDPLSRAPGLEYAVELVDEGGAVLQTLVLGSADGVMDAENASCVYSGRFALSFDRVGTHAYTIRQRVAAPGKDDFCRAYDAAQYTLTVVVINGEGGLQPVMEMYRLPDAQADAPSPAEKQTTAAFVNEYGTDVTLVKKWRGMPSGIPNVTLTLSREGYPDTDYSLTRDNLVDAKAVESVWQRTLTLPYDCRFAAEPALGFTVSEKIVPSGYAARVEPGEVSDSGLDVSLAVANCYVLIQTGQLNWPIPVLAGVGALLVAAGVVLCRRRDEHA